MNKKAQITIGAILMAFIGVLVGVVLFLTVMQTIGQSTTALAFTGAGGNFSFVIPANGSAVDWTGQDLLSTPVVYNATGQVQTAATYTVGERVSPTTGVKTIYFQSDTVGVDEQGDTVNATYQYGADGYIASSGARGVASIIGIFMALAIVVIALVPALRSDVLKMMGR